MVSPPTTEERYISSVYCVSPRGFCTNTLSSTCLPNLWPLLYLYILIFEFKPTALSPLIVISVKTSRRPVWVQSWSASSGLSKLRRSLSLNACTQWKLRTFLITYELRRWLGLTGIFFFSKGAYLSVCSTSAPLVLKTNLFSIVNEFGGLICS